MTAKSDHRSKFSNLSNWKEEAWKKSGLQRSRFWMPLKPWFCSGFFLPIAQIGKFAAMITLRFFPFKSSSSCIISSVGCRETTTAVLMKSKHGFLHGMNLHLVYHFPLISFLFIHDTVYHCLLLSSYTLTVLFCACKAICTHHPVSPCNTDL